MRLASRALGQSSANYSSGDYPVSATGPASCGPNPCQWYDEWWTTDTCANWLQCAGLPPVTFGSELESGTASLASGVGSGVAGVLSSPTTDVLIVGIVIAAVGVWMLLDKL